MAYREFGFSILHAEDEPRSLQVLVAAAVVLKGHEPTQVQLLHVLVHNTHVPASAPTHGNTQKGSRGVQLT